MTVPVLVTTANVPRIYYLYHILHTAYASLDLLSDYSSLTTFKQLLSLKLDQKSFSGKGLMNASHRIWLTKVLN